MASKQVFKFLKESKEGSKDSISNSGSSSEKKPEDKNDNPGFTVSCPPVLEPSKDESRDSDGRPQNRSEKLFARSCPPQLSTKEASTSSSGGYQSHEDEQQRSGEHPINNEQQANEPQTNCCAAFMDCYYNWSHKIGGSWFIHIFQFIISLICVSAIVMGAIFFNSCEGRYPKTDPVLAILMGLSGLFLIYKWLSKVCRQRRGEYYWNHDKNRLIMYFAAVLFFMALEFMYFCQMSPKNLQSQRENKCVKTYYDYLYYMHIVNAGCLMLTALLYLPDCCIYMYAFQRMMPSHMNGHYQPL